VTILLNKASQLTDTVTSLTLSTMGIAPPTGVSINISCEFVRPGGIKGAELYGVGEVVQLGKTLAYTRVSFYTPPPENKLVAYGSHTKHMGKNVAVTRFSADGEEVVGMGDGAAKEGNVEAKL
jgi:acyl-coenzyme A thioesterase 13